jgi:hypothetical protein
MDEEEEDDCAFEDLEMVWAVRCVGGWARGGRGVWHPFEERKVSALTACGDWVVGDKARTPTGLWDF